MIAEARKLKPAQSFYVFQYKNKLSVFIYTAEVEFFIYSEKNPNPHVLT